MQIAQYSSINSSGNLEEIGRGGEGRVYRVRSLPGLVFKEFLDNRDEARAIRSLEELAATVDSMSSNDQSWIRSRTTWPEQLVLSGNRIKGFLMPIISNEYFRKFGAKVSPKHVPCDWNYLSMRNKFASNKNIYSEVPRVTQLDVLAVVLDLAKTLKILHEHQIVVGDISGRNLLWTDKPDFRTLLIDCDSFHFEGRIGGSIPKQSPDWEDPTLSTALTTIESDLYKLGLATFRGVWSATTLRPTPADLKPPTQDIPVQVCDLVKRAVGSSPRPTAEEWVRTLSPAIAYQGRGAIQMGAGSQVRPPSGPVVSSDKSAEIPRPARPVINIRE